MNKKKGSIKDFLREHAEASLASLAVLFIAVIAGFFYAAIHMIIPQFDRALATPVPPPTSGFDLNAASQINYRGLLGSASSPAGTAPVGAGTASGTVSPISTTTAN